MPLLAQKCDAASPRCHVCFRMHCRSDVLDVSFSADDPKRTRQMIRLADGVVFDYVVPIFNMVTSTAKDSNGA
jgi:hypothetical protein